MDIWALWAFVTASNVMLLAAVGLGAYVVYKTKREDGRVFTAAQAQDTSKAVHLDDFVGMMDEETGDGEIPEPELAGRNSQFRSQFTAGHMQ